MELERSGIAWQVTLSHDEVEMIDQAATLAPLPPEIQAALKVVIGMVRVVDKIGGKKGVHIAGVLGTMFTTVTPRGFSPLGLMTKIGTAVVEFAKEHPEVIVGVLFPPALIPALVVGHLIHHRAPPVPGSICADRNVVGPWERFTLMALPHGEVALLSWMGFLCAINGGGESTYANRTEIGPWERWRIVKNDDGTISLTIGGAYFVAEGGGGRECRANRTKIGPWEKFHMVYQPDGSIALRTIVTKQYVCVQQ